MTKMKKPVTFETTFGIYSVDELLGEGGAGRVYGGVGPDRTPVAVKVLAEERASADKRGRFKNEISFLMRNKHRNIVTVIDHGVARGGAIEGPFYVMRRYQSSLRQLMQKAISPDGVLPLFSQILDGVEAAHLQEVIHRDLKPENILYDSDSGTLAIADFGIARFTEGILATNVETKPTQRLANFLYAAPEQRTPGKAVGVPADLYALGLILNEMFTNDVPLGTEYRSISSVSKELSFLDDIVARMLRAEPTDRPGSIANLKALIQRYQAEAITTQRLSQYNGTVIASREIDDPLAKEPPRLVSFDWDGRNHLTLILDRKVSSDWVNAFRHIGNYTSVMGKGPDVFNFDGDKAHVQAQEHEVQPVINYFKTWLPIATNTLRDQLESQAKRQEAEQREKLRQQREIEERRLHLMQRTQI